MAASRGRRPKPQPLAITHLTEEEIKRVIYEALPPGMRISSNGASVPRLLIEAIRQAEEKAAAEASPKPQPKQQKKAEVSYEEYAALINTGA